MQTSSAIVEQGKTWARMFHWNKLQNLTDVRILSLISKKNWECPQAKIYPTAEADKNYLKLRQENDDLEPDI